MILILLGAPGSGKGTQSERISLKYDICHISTGDILRQSITDSTELGQKAKKYMDKGHLVPDGIIIEAVIKRLGRNDCQKGYLLDGFPRTLNQAKKLDSFTKVDLVLSLETNAESLIKRITGRRTCPDCKKVYHIDTYSNKHCECGGELFIRSDDSEEMFKTRYELYENMTKPLKNYYQKTGKLVSIDASKHPDEVFKEIEKTVDIYDKR